MVAVPACHAQVRLRPVASGLQRGGRYICAHGTRPIGGATQQTHHPSTRHRRCVVSLRRCGHHAGPLSHIRGRGAQSHTPTFEKAVVPLSLAILIGLFAMQRRGTARVASLFGPIILVWFAIIATMGVICIIEEPSVLRAFNPSYGVSFLINNGFTGLTVLGLVFLAITGAEALYADLGH